MSKIVLTNAFVSINGVDLSSSVQQVGINRSNEVQDRTTMGATGRQRLPGLNDESMEFTFAQDFDANQVDATLFPLVGAAAFPIIVRPDAGAVSATNPQYTMNGVLQDYAPLGNSVGELAVAPVTIPADGTIARATS